jgi:hypothetical protein
MDRLNIHMVDLIKRLFGQKYLTKKGGKKWKRKDYKN